MSNSVYGIALSGLNVARAGLTTTSNNIANANTVGYSRQEMVANARPANFSGGAYIGQGVDVETVRRVYSDYLSSQQRDATTQAAFSTAQFEQISRLDGIIADEASGLGTALTDFFAAAQLLTTNPSDLPARQNFLSTAESLATRFNAVNSVMDGLRTSTNLRVTDVVEQINTTSQQIAELNKQIVQISNQSFNQSPPNDLLDKRDQLITTLSEQIQVTPVYLDDGSVNVFLTNGQPLVVKNEKFDVQVQEDPTDRENLLVGVTVPVGGNDELIAFRPGTLGGGSLSGFLEFRENELAEYQNQLGAMAAQMALTINDIQAKGVDLRNFDLGNLTVPGGPIFGFKGSADNADPFANLQAISKVTVGEDNASANPAILNRVDFSRLQGQDFEVRMSSSGVPEFRIKGTKAYIPLATPNATDTANLFTGAFKIPDTSGLGPNPTLAQLNAAPPLVSFDFPAGVANGDTFTIYPTRNAARNIEVATRDPAAVATALRNGQTEGLEAGAAIKAVDPERGDNDLATQFAALSETRLLFKTGGSNGLSMVDSFSQMVSKIGNKTREFEIASEARQSILDQTLQTRDSFSGVNMDEEAANLLKFQQSYQASGRVISLSKELFELVLGIFQ